MPRMSDTPIYDTLGGGDPAPDEAVIPDDVLVWTDEDELSVADAPEANGTGDQTGGLGPL